MRYKNNQNSMYSVRTSTYLYATRKVCTFSLRYVLLSWILYSVRTKYIRFWEVRTRYVLCVNSTYLYVLWVKSTYLNRAEQGGTVPCGVPTCTGTYWVRTTVHYSRWASLARTWYWTWGVTSFPGPLPVIFRVEPEPHRLRTTATNVSYYIIKFWALLYVLKHY